jgi:hypothetical protein
MKQSATQDRQPANPDWQLLGQLKLPAGSIPDELIAPWLARALESFNLPPDLFEKLKASVYDVASRIFESLAQATGSYQADLSIYVPRNILLNRLANRSWGFFRIEKSGIDSDQGISIEYYFYLEE